MKFIAMALFLSNIAHAHFEIGTYEGKLLNGDKCQFEILSVNFSNNLRHPLNENVQMKINFLGNKEITASHLPLVDSVKGTVRPKNKVLTSVWATPTGAEAIELIMNEDGPAEIFHLVDNYRDAQLMQRTACVDLNFKK